MTSDDENNSNDKKNNDNKTNNDGDETNNDKIGHDDKRGAAGQTTTRSTPLKRDSSQEFAAGQSRQELLYQGARRGSLTSSGSSAFGRVRTGGFRPLSS